MRLASYWRCRGRTATETPLLLINQIDVHPHGGQILHVSISDIQVCHAGLPDGILDTLPHIPVIAQTLERSAAEYVGDAAPTQDYLPGYAEWKAVSTPAMPARSGSRWRRSCRSWKASWPGAISSDTDQARRLSKH